MNIIDIENKTKKLNMLAEIKIFKFLKKSHKEENHENKNIYNCDICCDLCDQMLEEFLYANNQL